MAFTSHVLRRIPEERMSRVLIIQRYALSHGFVLALLVLLAASNSFARDEIEREGYFEVRSAATALVDGVHTLDARLQLVLSSEALRALASGVPLTIEFSFRAEGVIRVRGDGMLEVRGVVPPSDLKKRYAAHRTRQLDLVLRDVWAGGGARRDLIRLHLGPYACPRLPKGVAIKNRFGQFSLSWVREGPRRIRIRRQVLLRAGRVLPRDYPAFREFLEEIDRAERAPLVL